MNPTVDFPTHLETWITRLCWSSPVDALKVEEQSNDGEADVTFYLPPDRLCIQWQIGGTTLFNVLKQQFNADGAFMLQCPDGGWEAHIVECKKTVGTKTWHKARQQMLWTLARLRALSGILGFSISKVACYTAYREEKQSPAKSTSPTDFKLWVGPAGPGPEPLSEGFTLIRQWEEGRLQFSELEEQIPHQRIELDRDTGKGSFDLRSVGGI